LKVVKLSKSALASAVYQYWKGPDLLGNRVGVLRQNAKGKPLTDEGP